MTHVSDARRLYPQRVAREFEDVYLEELPRLLLVREVNFRIKLELGTVPISKAPYKMTPIELK